MGISSASTVALAEGRLDARYEASLAGIAIGKGSWIIDIGEDQYAAAASGTTSGILKSFASGSGTGATTGKVLATGLAPANYTASITMYKKTETVRISLQNGGVKDSSIEPLPKVNPDRLPVTDDDLRQVIDPMTATLLRVPGTGEVMAPGSCRASVPVFDGRMRYDLIFDYRRSEAVKAEKGYQGQALVCSVQFVPKSGYVPERAAVKYLAAQKNIEIWLVPVAGTRVLAPFRIVMPTPFGQAKMEALEFNTTSGPRVARTTQ